MPTSIPLTGLAASDPLPGNYFEVLFAQGPASSGQAIRGALIIANKSTAGTATVDTVIYGLNSTPALATTNDAITLFGQGSEAHRMFKRFLAVNQTTPLYVICPAESAGAAATGVITLTTTATNNATLRTYVGDEFVDTAITNGDTVTTIASNAVLQINSKLDWPVTAGNSSGVITLTAKNKGPRGNWIRFSAFIIGTSVGTTSSATATAFFTGGTTADSNTNALATILPFRYYYIISAAEDATQLGALVSQVNTQALPTNGLLQRVFAGSVDTLSNGITIATGINGARAEIEWLAQSDAPPSELAANGAAVYSLEEAKTVPRLNFDGYGNDPVTQTNWKLKAPRSGVAPTRAQLVSALNNGLTPIGVNQNGSTYLVSRITTRSLSGSTADYRIRDAHKVTVCDFFADDLKTKFNLQLNGKQIADDPAQGQRVPGSVVVTPRVEKAAITKLVDDYADNDLLQNRDAIKAGTIVIRETSPSTRMGARVPLQPADVLHQTATEIDQVS